MSTLAENTIATGNGAIFDFIASYDRVKNLWPELLSKQFTYIECICSDEQTHKKRLKQRERSIDGWHELSWDDVVRIKRHYTILRTDKLVLDAVNNLSDNIRLAIEYISKNTYDK